MHTICQNFIVTYFYELEIDYIQHISSLESTRMTEISMWEFVQMFTQFSWCHRSYIYQYNQPQMKISIFWEPDLSDNRKLSLIMEGYNRQKREYFNFQVFHFFPVQYQLAVHLTSFHGFCTSTNQSLPTSPHELSTVEAEWLYLDTKSSTQLCK